MQSKRIKTAVFVSGGGTNLQALIDDTTTRKDATANIVLVVSDVVDAYALERAKRAGIEALVVQEHDQEVFERKVQDALGARGVELICLAGFMRILSAQFVQEWEGKILNIHPSLLPKFPGLRTHKRAIRAHGERTWMYCAYCYE